MCRAQVTELTDLLKWTVPHFGGKPLRECFLSHQELILINNIAIGYGEMGNMQKAVGLLRELKEYLECSYRENREIATMHATVLLNLVKYWDWDSSMRKRLRKHKMQSAFWPKAEKPLRWRCCTMIWHGFI